MTRYYLSLLLAVFLIAGTVLPSFAAQSKDVKEIGITYVKFPLNVPAIIAYKNNMFENEFKPDGITITRPELTSGPKQTQAMAAGSVQFASVLGASSAIIAKSNGVDLKIIAVFARAPKAFNIMAADKSIKSIKDLKNKIVAGPKGTVLHQMLYAALLKEGLTPSDIKFVNMSIPQARAALMSGSVSAALVAGPSVPDMEKGGCHVIVNGEGLIQGLIVVAVDNNFLKAHPDLVKRYLAVNKKSAEFMKNNPEKTFEIVAKETNLTVENAKKMFPWYDYSSAITGKDIKDLEVTQEFLLNNGMMKNKIDIKDLISNIEP